MEDLFINTTLIKLGRILYAIPVFIFGIFHFMNAQAMSGMVPEFLPGGTFWIILTGLGMVAAAVSIVINIKTRLAAILLAVMLLIFILTIHIPNIPGNDPATSQMSMISLMKDFAMAAGALVISGLPGQEKKE